MELKIWEKIQTICQRLYARNMLAATDGNISYRCHDDKILITATGRAKAFMDNKDLAVINLSGQTFQGEPSGNTLCTWPSIGDVRRLRPLFTPIPLRPSPGVWPDHS